MFGEKEKKTQSNIFIDMLPKTFQQQNIKKKDALTAQLKLYTITYDYELKKYYAEFIKDSYNQWGNIVDNLGVMKLTGYDIEEVRSNFHQIMDFNYVLPHKIKKYEIVNISEELIIPKSIS
jgi:hypothetical protein